MSLIVPILGTPIAQVGPSYPSPFLLPPLADILTTASPCFSTGPLIDSAGNPTGATFAWFAANMPMAVPFVLAEAITVYQLGWRNGTAGNNVDIGVYSTAWVRLVSTGSTAESGSNTIQSIDVADTFLPAGRYYLAMVMDVVAASNQFGYTTNLIAATSPSIAALAGVLDSTTAAFPLPDPLTNMVPSALAQNIPLMHIAKRALM